MKPEKKIRIGVVAPSSVVPADELKNGIKFLETQGFEVEVHSTVWGQDFFYPASDSARANAFLEFAFRKDLDLIWFARGGYGATHLLPLLMKATLKRKPPKKTLLGFSDATALLEFCRTRWKWNSIHAPMPSSRSFTELKATEWNSILEQINFALGRIPAKRLSASHFQDLEPIHLPKTLKKIIKAPLVGGNLSVWNALIGTPFSGRANGSILFLEEIQENIARINRMIHHLEQSKGLKGVRAIILGDFTDCHDTVMKINDQPIRKTYPASEALNYVFQQLGQRLNVPIWKNVPVGHGPNYHALSLGRTYTLNSKGELKLT